nr:uncharacterized protein LOC113823773 [Penaeus vannamei]
MYRDAATRMRSSVGETDGSEVKAISGVERREDLQINLERWRTAVEERGIRISRSKTEYMCTYIDGGSIRMDEELKRVEMFKYLGSIVDASGNRDEEVKHRVQAGWNNWRSASGVLWDKKVPLRLKGKFHRTAITLACFMEQKQYRTSNSQERVARGFGLKKAGKL